MSTTPQAPPGPAPIELRCPRCAAVVEPEQDWCLQCGAAARTRLAPTPNWRAPVASLALVAVLAGVALAVAFVALTDDDEGTTTTPAATTAPATAVTPAVTQTAPVATTPGAVVPGTTTPGAVTPGTTTPGAVTPGTTTPGATTAPAQTVTVPTVPTVPSP